MRTSSSDGVTLGRDQLGWPTVEFGRSADPTQWQLWPVTWWHFERLLAEPSGERRHHAFDLADSYWELRKLAGRPPLGELETWESSGWVIGGIRPDEAKLVVSSIGNGWRLPTDQEWRDLYRNVAQGITVEHRALSTLHEACRSPHQRLVIRTVMGHLCAQDDTSGATSLFALMMMGRRGLDWVTYRGGEFGGRGNLVGRGARFIVHPDDSDPCHPLEHPRKGSRLVEFGVRAVRSRRLGARDDRGQFGYTSGAGVP